MMYTRTKNYNTSRQLVKAGWWRFFLFSFLGGITLLVATTAFIALFSVPKEDWHGTHPSISQTRFFNPKSKWVYTYPTETLIIPAFDAIVPQNALAVGIRIHGASYSESEQTTAEPKSLPSRYNTISHSSPDAQYIFTEDLVGFPFLCARSSFTIEIQADNRIEQVHEGYAIRGQYPAGSNIIWPREFAAIPFRPIFPGVLYNTMIYSIPFATAALSLRGWRVRKAEQQVLRERCIACGYHIQSIDQCPECATWKNIPWKRMLWAGCKKSDLKLIEPNSKS